MGKESSTPNKVLKNIILNMKLTLLLTLENVKKKQEPWLLEKVNVEGYKRKKKTDAHYIASEVKSGEPESTASALYASRGARGGSCRPDEVFALCFLDIMNFNTTASIPSQIPSAKAVSLLFARLSTK